MFMVNGQRSTVYGRRPDGNIYCLLSPKLSFLQLGVKGLLAIAIGGVYAGT
jgi:hypothetical protein